MFKFEKGKVVDIVSGESFNSLEDYQDKKGIRLRGFETADFLWKNYKILKEQKAYSYSLSSVLPFGKYKGYTLGDVWVIDSNYIEWCIENLTHFAVSEYLFEKIETNGIYYRDDLESFLEELNGETIIDLSSQRRNTIGLIKLTDIPYSHYSVSSQLKEENRQKLSSEMYGFLVLKGGTFDGKLTEPFWGKRKSIVIKLPTP